MDGKQGLCFVWHWLANRSPFVGSSLPENETSGLKTVCSELQP